MVNWQAALKGLPGCSTPPASPSAWPRTAQYERQNYNMKPSKKPSPSKPAGCLVGLDFNYPQHAVDGRAGAPVMTPIVTEHVDVLITTIEDMAELYGIRLRPVLGKQSATATFGHLEDDDIRALCRAGAPAIQSQRSSPSTIRYPDSFEQHRWNRRRCTRAALSFRSPAVKPITLVGPAGGGDTWNAGFLLWACSRKTGRREHRQRRAGGRRRHAAQADLDVRPAIIDKTESASV